MTDEQIALARRAIACPKWRWMPGMKVSEGFRVTESLAPFMFPVDLPDLNDPATLGCLLALVREAHHEPTYLPTCLDADDEAWVIESPKRERQTRYGSYASVLVAALESSP
jgi:hypothetical protein